MGYTTYFCGGVQIDPPLNEDEISFLNDLANTRRMRRTKGPLFVKGSGLYGQGNDPDILHNGDPTPEQPSVWCQWVPTDDGAGLVWDQGEKFYEAEKWMDYIVNKLLGPKARAYIDAHMDEDPRLASFTCDHICSGLIEAEGEDAGDLWAIQVVNNNVVTVLESQITYVNPTKVTS